MGIRKDGGSPFAGNNLVGRPQLGNVNRPTQTKLGGKKEEREQRLLDTAHDRRPKYTIGQILLHPMEVYRKSSQERIPAKYARQTGVAKNTGEPLFNRYELRSTRGLKRVGMVGAASIVALICLTRVTGGDSDNVTFAATSTSTPEATGSTGPGVFDLSTAETTTPALFPNETAASTTLAAVINQAVSIDLFAGDSGEEVRALQNQLITVGCSIGLAGADGHFGPATQEGLITFQTNAQLVNDGDYGPLTRADLNTALATGNTACGTGV